MRPRGGAARPSTRGRREPPAKAGSPARDVRNARIIGLIFGVYAGTIGVRIGVGAGLVFPTAAFLIGLLATLLLVSPRRVAALRISWIDYAVVFYVVIRVATEAINAERLSHPPSFPVAVNAIYYVVVYFCARLVVSDRTELRAFLGGLSLPAVLVSLIGVLQVLGVGFITSFVINFTQSDAVISRLSDGRLTRASSLIGHWSALGGYLCCAAAVAAVCLIMDKRAGRRYSRVQFVVFVASLVGVLSTFTFAVIAVAFVITVVAMVALGYRVRGILLLGGLAAVAWVVFGSSIETRLNIQDLPTTYLPPEYSWVPATIAVRISLWLTQTLPAIAEQPWLGWGHSVFGGIGSWPIYPVTVIWPYPESEYIKALINGGLLEFGALVLVFAGWLGIIRVGAGRVAPPARAVLTATFVSLLIASSINAYFTNQGVPSIWWAIVGAFAFARSERQPSAPDESSLNHILETTKGNAAGASFATRSARARRLSVREVTVRTSGNEIL